MSTPAFPPPASAPLHTLIALLGIIAVLPAAAGPDREDGTRAYKYEDENGVVHYGDYYPPTAATRERKKLNEYGIQIDELPAELTPEELREQEIRRRVEEEIAERERKRHEYITNLCRSYALEDDLHYFHESQLDAIRFRIAANDRKLRGLRQQILDLEEQAAGYNYPYSPQSRLPEPPEALIAQLLEVTDRIAEREEDAATLRRTRQDQQESYRSNLALYRERCSSAPDAAAQARAGGVSEE